MKKIVLSSALLAAFMATAQADTMKVTPLVTHTELGFIQTNGNTKTTTGNLDAKAKKSWGKHEGKILLDGQYSKDSGVETKNKYLIELNYNYNFTDRLSFDYLLGYKSDKFSSFDYQFYTGPGVKYKAIVSDIQNLSVAGNILYSSDKYNDTGKTRDYAGYKLSGDYDYKFSKTLKFVQELSIRGELAHADNYFAYSKSSIETKLSDIFSAGVGYKVDYVNKPTAGKKSTDTTFTFNLIMDY